MRVMGTVTGVVCDKEAQVRVMPKAMTMMRVVGDEEGEGSMATATATRVVGEQLQWQITTNFFVPSILLPPPFYPQSMYFRTTKCNSFGSRDE